MCLAYWGDLLSVDQCSFGGLKVFNLTCRMPGEKTDLWMVRYNGMGPANYWGFKQLRYSEAEEVEAR